MLKLIFSILLLAVPVSAEERCINKACFDSIKQIGEVEVPLQHAALAEYYFFDVYTLALYVPDANYRKASVLEDVPKSLVFHYHRDVSRDIMIDGADENLAERKISLDGRLKEINDAYVSVSEGDRYELRYQPGLGTTLLLNDKELVTVAGADFAEDYLGIWLSNKPLSNDLRRDLFSEAR